MKNFLLKMIAVVNFEFGLAKDGKILWSFPEDLKFFYQKTKNSIIIMGRKTFLSLDAPLKNRINYVISKKMQAPVDNVFVFNSLESALENIRKKIDNNCLEEKILTESGIWLIGGAELFNYALKLHLIDEAFITKVNTRITADIFLNSALLNYLKKECVECNEKYSILHYFR